MIHNESVYKRSFIIIFLLAIHLGAVEKQSNPTVQIGGFSQVTAIRSEDNQAFQFGLDRVRLFAKGVVNDHLDYKVMVDFVKQAVEIDKDGDTPGLINDAVLIYKPASDLQVFVGKFKTPLGMEFNTSGSKLDFVKTGLNSNLIFDRNVGIMVEAKSVRKTGINLSAGIFNSGPKNANTVGSVEEGQDYTVASRMSYDRGKQLHTEIYYGSALTHVTGQESVDLIGVGYRWNAAKVIQLKGEYLSRNDKTNPLADGWDFYLQAGYLVERHLETVAKFEKIDLTDGARDRRDITFGFNIFLNPQIRYQSRIQLNYVLSDLKGKSAFQVMFQGCF